MMRRWIACAFIGAACALLQPNQPQSAAAAVCLVAAAAVMS